MEFQYCPVCGASLEKREIGDEGMVPFCRTCRRPFFRFSSPCVLCLVVDGCGSILLIKQAYVSESYVCVAGYVQEGETIEDSARREVEEETGLQVEQVRYLKSYYYEKRDNLMLGFVCTVKKASLHLSCEVDSAGWFLLEEAGNLLRKSSVAAVLLKDYMQECSSWA